MTKQNSEIRIALVGSSLGGGGAEKIHANLSTYFSQKGISVHNIIFVDLVAYDYEGELLNLGKMVDRNKWDKFRIILFLRRFFRQHSFDYIIDFRHRVNHGYELLLSTLAYNTRVIYMVNSGMDYRIPRNVLVKKLMYANSYAMVTVSERITATLKPRFDFPVVTLHTPIFIEAVREASSSFVPAEENYIVAVGRMNEMVKQFDKLIEAYALSVLPEQGVKLLLLGDGKYLQELKKQAGDLGLAELVIFKGFQKNPYPYEKNALFMVLSSKNEGFPNVLIESLCNDTPVISFDCFTGPSEIIKDRENGLLVEDQNVGKLAAAMSEMYRDKSLRDHCAQQARQSVAKFSLEEIGKKWLHLMQIEA